MRKRLLLLLSFSTLLPGFAAAQSYLPLFDNVADAYNHCPYDQVVWLKPQSAVTQRYKGQKTANPGGYVCKGEAIGAGYGGLVTHLQPLSKP